MNRSSLRLLALTLGSFTLAARATTYYVSPTGNDAYAGTVQQAPWKTVARVNAQRFFAGDQILFLSGGTWREQLIPSTSNLSFGAYGSGARPVISGANLYTSGWTNAGNNVWQVTTSQTPEQVWFNGALGESVSSQSAVIAPNQWFATGATLYVYSQSSPSTAFTSPGIEAAQRDSALMIGSITGTTVSGLAFVNPQYVAIDIGSNAAGTQSFTNVLWQGAQYEGLRAEGGSQVITSSKGLYNSIGIGVEGGSGATINNSILSGNSEGAIEIYGTSGPTRISSSTISGNVATDPLAATIRNYSPNTLTISNSIILPNPESSLSYTYIGVTDDGTNVNASPAFANRAAPLILIPYVDDYNNLSVAQAVANVAHNYGCHLSYAVNTKLINANGWAALQAMNAAGDEIVAHTRSHSDLANNNVFTVQYSGPAPTATMSINTSTGTIQTFLNGSSTPDLNIDISNTYNYMDNICSEISANGNYSCAVQTNQDYFTPAILANVTGVNIKTPYLAAAASNYLNWEVEGAISDIQANIPGYTVKSFATPFTSSSLAVENHIRDAGIQANRNGVVDANLNLNGNWLLHDLDIYNMGAMWLPNQFDASKPVSSTAALVEGMGAAGGVMGVYAHGYDEFTLASWQALFQNMQAEGATCMTLSQAIASVKSGSTLVPDGTNKRYVRAVPLTPNYANTSASPSQGAHNLQ